MIERAFVLGAGLGTRLRPLTDALPKPLVPIFQKPLITFALDHLAAAGVQSFVINTHHLPNEYRTCFKDDSYNGRPVRLVHEPDLLETGGGIKNAQPLLGEGPFIVYSGDILTDLPLASLIDEHLAKGNDVTLALRETGLGTDVALRGDRVIDIGGRYGHAGSYDYANISVWNAAIFERIPARKKISFIPILAQWIGEGGRIGGLLLEEGRWFNIGSRREYLAIHRTIAEERWRPDYVQTSSWPVFVSPRARVDPSAQLRGFHSVGDDCSIGAGAIVEDSILWPGAQIAPKSQLRNCIVRTNHSAAGMHRDLDI